MRDDARPQPVVERDLAVLHLILEVPVRERAVRAGESVSARSCVVTRPTAPREEPAARSPPRRSDGRKSPIVQDLAEEEEQRERPGGEIDEFLQPRDSA